MKNEITEPYELLANAIIRCAANDYRETRTRSKYCVNSYQKIKIEDKAIQIEEFFLSDYADVLCRGLNEVILEKLQAEFE